MYRKDRVKIQSKIKKIIIKKEMGWCDDPNSRNYNKIIKLPSSYKYEKLYKKENIYDIIVVLNYNMDPIVKNKGSAIFIHVAKKKLQKNRRMYSSEKSTSFKNCKRFKKKDYGFNREPKIELPILTKVDPHFTASI